MLLHTSMVRRHTRLSGQLPVLGVVAGSVALAGAGAILALGILIAGRGGIRDPPAYEVGRDAVTSFGTVAIQQVELLGGLSAQDLGGMTHGVQNLVPPDKVQLQLSILLTNSSPRPVLYALTDQFRLVSETGDDAEQLPGLAAPIGSLPGHSSLSAVLRFMAPRDSDDLFLEFRDPGEERPVRIHIVAGDRVPQSSLDNSHDHLP